MSNSTVNATANATVAAPTPFRLVAAVPATDVGAQTFSSNSVLALAGGW